MDGLDSCFSFDNFGLYDVSMMEDWALFGKIAKFKCLICVRTWLHLACFYIDDFLRICVCEMFESVRYTDKTLLLKAWRKFAEIGIEISVKHRVIHKKIKIIMIEHTIFARSNSIFSDQNACLLSYNNMAEGLVKILLDHMISDKPYKWPSID